MTTATQPENCRKAAANAPLWRPLQRFTCAELPPGIRPWLTDDGSLTDRLIGLGKGEFKVQRLYQGWEVPKLCEQRVLDVRPRSLSMVREVMLTLDDRAVVFARSVFPLSSLSGELAHLRKLQNKSLGAILFQHPGMRRSPFEIAQIPGNSDYLPPHLHQSAFAWGRRSRFDIAGKPLLVSEVFLNAFTPWRALLPVHRSQRGRVSAAILAATQ